MKTEIHHAPGNAAARIALEPNETVTTEGGAMIAMSADLAVQTTTQQRTGGGGLLKAAKRLLSGESFFLNHYTAGEQGGELWLAATLPGDMLKLALEGESVIVQAGSFVACAAVTALLRNLPNGLAASSSNAPYCASTWSTAFSWACW